MPAAADQNWRESDMDPELPGHIWLRSMLVPVLAHALQPYLAPQAGAQAVEAGAIGGIIGNIMRGQ